MALDFSSALSNPLEFLFSQLWPSVQALDPVAIAALGAGIIVLFVLLIIAFKFFAWVLSIVKRFILFFIILLSLTVFVSRFQDKIFSPQPDLTVMAVGAAGVVFALIALMISLLSLGKKVRETRYPADEEPDSDKVIEEELNKELAKKAKVAATPSIRPMQLQQPQMFTKQALLDSFHDRSLLAVLSYIVVAEFGVFSSVTVGAPNPIAGIGLFAAFMIAAFVFIRTSYHDYLLGIRHLVIGTVFAILLSILLGHFWVEQPLGMLLSLNYFTTNSLVAFITGLAVSLFMGSKG